MDRFIRLATTGYSWVALGTLTLLTYIVDIKPLAVTTAAARRIQISKACPQDNADSLVSDWEIKMRIHELANLATPQVHEELQKWSYYQSLNLRERAQIMRRILMTQEVRRELAARKLQELGLCLPPAKLSRFEYILWEKCVRSEKILWHEYKSRINDLNIKIDKELIEHYAGTVNSTYFKSN